MPPPILANWRKYLLEQLTYAFPEHGGSDRIAVQSLFDFARSSSVATITPREMKLFVNGLVVLYRQRGDEIPLPAMAAYLLHKDAIVGTEIHDDFLSGTERRMVDDPEWRSLIVALHFGVSPDEAKQLLLQEPILIALREGSTEKLKKEENRHGFFDVLPKVVLEELDKPQKGDGVALAQMAETIGALEGAARPDLGGVWRSMRRHLGSVAGWDGFQISPAEGIKAILAHAPEDTRLNACKMASQSLSRAAVPEPDGDFQVANPAAANWLTTAAIVVDKASDPQSLSISIPGSPKFKLEMLQQLAESDVDVVVKTTIKLNAPPEELNAAIVAEITAGRFMRAPAIFVPFVSKTLKIQFNWAAIAKAAADRLRVPSIGANECHSLTTLLVSAATIAQHAKAIPVLKDLSNQGHLSHLLHQHRKSMNARAALHGAILLANPTFERGNQTENSASGDTAFNETIAASQFDATLIAEIASFIMSVRAGAQLLQIGAQNSNISRYVAAIIGSIVKSPYEFDSEPQLVIDQWGFLETHEDLIPTKNFIGNLSKRKELVDLLAGQPFEVRRCGLYSATTGMAEASGDTAYLAFLERGILTLDQATWEKVLNSTSGPYFDLVQLCSDLRNLGIDFDLSTSTRDALLAQIRKAGKGEIGISEEAHNRLATILGLLQKGLRTSLMRDVVDDMAASTDQALIDRVIGLLGDHIDLGERSDADRIVRRIFTPIVNGPSEHTAAWMRRMVEGRPDFFKQLSGDSKQEFGTRVQAALRAKDPLSEGITASLKTIASILNLDLDANHQNDGGTAGKDAEG